MEHNIRERQKNEIEKKLYRIFSMTGGIANSIGFIASAILFGMTIGTLVCGICALLLLFMAFVGNKDGGRKRAEAVILLLLNFLEFPFLYYAYGKGTMPYMVLGIVGTAVFMSGHVRKAMLAAEILFDATVILLTYVYPSTIEKITEQNSIGSTVCSFVIVAVSVGAMLTLLLKQYDRQQAELYDMGNSLENMAKQDPLTGLYNRRYLTNYIEEKLKNQKQSFFIVLIDIDDFKEVNDTCGHVYGEQVLQRLGEILKWNISGKGIAARYGGEEFMLVFSDSDREGLTEVMEQTAVELKKFSMETRQIEITFSGGVEEVKSMDRITPMFNAADERLYQAKKEGKNRIVF